MLHNVNRTGGCAENYLMCAGVKSHKNDYIMKKYILLLIVALMCGLTGYAWDKYSIDRNDLPQAAQDFLTEYFPKAKIGMVKTDKHLLKKTDYDVRLVNGTKIEFSNAGKWTSVDCKNSAVPDGIIPKAIRNYVNKNFSGVKITSIRKTATKYEAGLSDGVTLEFNLLGQFKKMHES